MRLCENEDCVIIRLSRNGEVDGMRQCYRKSFMVKYIFLCVCQEVCADLGLALEVDDADELICPGDVCSSENVKDQSGLPVCLDAIKSGKYTRKIHVK